jgi:hypothetical protein
MTPEASHRHRGLREVLDAPRQIAAGRCAGENRAGVVGPGPAPRSHAGLPLVRSPATNPIPPTIAGSPCGRHSLRHSDHLPRRAPRRAPHVPAGTGAVVLGVGPAAAGQPTCQPPGNSCAKRADCCATKCRKRKGKRRGRCAGCPGGGLYCGGGGCLPGEHRVDGSCACSGASSPNGCRDGRDCLPGTSDQARGANGAVCHACAADRICRGGVCESCLALRAACTDPAQCCRDLTCEPIANLGQDQCCRPLGGACSTPGGFDECCAVVFSPGNGTLVYCAPNNTSGGPGAPCSSPDTCVSSVCCGADDQVCCAAGQQCVAGQCVDESP